jgi:hypothetical protein
MNRPEGAALFDRLFPPISTAFMQDFKISPLYEPE